MTAAFFAITWVVLLVFWLWCLSLRDRVRTAEMRLDTAHECIKNQWASIRDLGTQRLRDQVRFNPHDKIQASIDSERLKDLEQSHAVLVEELQERFAKERLGL